MYKCVCKFKLCKKVFAVAKPSQAITRKYCSLKCAYEDRGPRRRFKLVCKQCKKSFSVEGRFFARRRKFCSQECGSKAKVCRRRVKRVCKFCKKQFGVLPFEAKRKFCSKDCFYRDQTKRAIKVCRGCGKKFVGYSQGKGQLYCSWGCKVKTLRLPKKSCVACGRCFVPKKRRQIVCSVKCRQTRSRKDLSAVDLSVAENRRHTRLKRKYGISIEDYKAILKAQGGVCAITGKRSQRGRNGKKIRLCLDHNHITKQVRGILHRDPNFAFGVLGVDDANRALKVVQYLVRYCLTTEDGLEQAALAVNEARAVSIKRRLSA